MNPTTSLDSLAINTIRTLSIDMVQAANSGHPGLPLGAAPMAFTLYRHFLKFDPSDPNWFDRDRFILSPGHGSALLYSLLHVFGYDVSKNDLKQFRQLGSKTPGHPEVGLTPGVECTTGPLGQGFANGVGMAIAEQWLAARFNTGDAKVIDHYTYAIVSDGDLMEGVAMEAASLAGHLKLGKLIYLYDSNDISLDGPCSLSYSEDVADKFRAMGWHVQTQEDGNDVESLSIKIEAARKEVSAPSLIIVRTEIGYGSPLAGSSKAHGAPLGAENVAMTKAVLGFDAAQSFVVPEEVENIQADARQKGDSARKNWDEEFTKLANSSPALAAELRQIIEGKLPENWDSNLDELAFEGNIASRDTGKSALNALSKSIPWMIGGGADLASSTKTTISDSGEFSAADYSARNVFFGVREHAMGSVVNGIALHGLIPFCSTFLVFSDYMRGAIRLAALSELPSIFVFTHDSVFVGEDGPTHQPIEHVAALRLIPGLEVWRPADGYETAEAWRESIQAHGPSALILTRQGLPTLPNKETVRQGVKRGGYVLVDAENPVATLVATGSEVALAMEAAEKLQATGKPIRVVSMPSVERFQSQPDAYRHAVLMSEIPTIAVEAGVTAGWLGLADAAVGIDRFGESGPGDVVYKHLGMSAEAVVNTVLALLNT